MPDYDYLITDLKDSTENDSSEFASHLPKIINRAEIRLTQDLDDYGLTVYTSVAVSANDALVSIPSGTRLIKNFNVVVGGSRRHLLLRTDEYIKDYWPVSASVNDPVYYSKRGHTAVRIAPTPTSTYDGELVTIVRPTTLTSVATTNYFTDFCYDALFKACMLESAMFLKSWNDVPLWEAQYKHSIDSLRNQARRNRRDDMEMNASPAGGDNTVLIGSN
jgi:hypothetical protein